MLLRYTFDSPIVRDEDHGFIRHYDVHVFGFGEDGSQLIFRDLHLQVPYAARHPLGEEIDFDARPEQEEWVLKQWKT